MSVDIRLPDINAGTTAEQFQQMKSYLYQLAQQLNWALNTLETGGGNTESGVVIMNTGGGGGGEYTEKTPEETFEEIKALIIESAEIVDAYYEDISKRLEGVYVAQSDFGTYTEEVSAEIVANAEAITQNYNYYASLQTSVEDMGAAFDNYKAETGGYIRTGIVYYDENSLPVYGVAVGQNLTTITVDGETVIEQNNFRAIFTAEKLSFWQGDAQVAYLSNQQLYVTNIVALEKIKLGSWRIGSDDGFVIKWIGGTN